MADTHAEGGISANLNFKSGPQALPTSGPENTYPFGIGGFDTDRVDANDMSNDDERPSPPNPDAKIGTDMNLASVAPYKYGEFPKDSISTGMTRKQSPTLGG